MKSKQILITALLLAAPLSVSADQCAESINAYPNKALFQSGEDASHILECSGNKCQLQKDTTFCTQGINIKKSGTIIEGNGYWISGNQRGDGVKGQDINYTTIKNINIEGFKNGLNIDNTNKLNITNVQSYNNSRHGIKVTNTQGTNIINVASNSNGKAGIFLSGDDIAVNGASVTLNDKDGLYYNGQNKTDQKISLENINATKNTRYGIHTKWTGEDTQIKLTRNNVTENGKKSFAIFEPKRAIPQGNSCDGPGNINCECIDPVSLTMSGALTGDGSEVDKYISCTGSMCQVKQDITFCGDGIALEEEMMVLECNDFKVRGSGKGVGITTQNNSRIQNCNVSDFGVGIDLTEKHNTTISNIISTNNANSGVRLKNASNITLSSIQAKQNTVGINMSHSANTALTLVNVCENKLENIAAKNHQITEISQSKTTCSNLQGHTQMICEKECLN